MGLYFLKNVPVYLQVQLIYQYEATDMASGNSG